ncbi:MAG: RcnB family protein [Ramlibacter sp.]
MIKRLIHISALVVMTATSGSSFAQGDGDAGAQELARQQFLRGQLRTQPYTPAQRRSVESQVVRDPRFDQQSRGFGPQYREERGAGPDHRFHRGDRLPAYYRSRSYVVDDWRGHRLSAPPRGYHWVQSGSDYLLVAIATGIIAQLLINN